MKTKRHLTVLALILVMVVIVASAWFIQLRLESELRHEVGRSLQAVVGITEQALLTWARQQKKTVTTWANDKETIRLTRQLLQAPRNPEALRRHPAQRQLRRKLTPVLEDNEYRGYFVIAPDMISLASMHDVNIGNTNPLTRQPQFLQHIQHTAALSLPQRSDVPLPDEQDRLQFDAPTLFVGTPIRDQGKTIAYFTFRLIPHKEFKNILQRGRVGETGETYAFSRRGLLLSFSRYDRQLQELGLLQPGKQGMLNLYLYDPQRNLLSKEQGFSRGESLTLTRMAMSATQGHKGMDLEGYRDYRGVPVVGAWRWNEELGFGIATEIDIEEAYRPIATLRYFTFGGSTVVALLITLLGMLFFNFNRGLENRVKGRTRELNFNLKLLDSISYAQTLFINNADIRNAFDTLLARLLDLSESEYGFIGEVLHRKDGTPYLRSYAITNIAWNKETRHFYEQNIRQGMEFYNLDTLFGSVVTSGKPVIANDPPNDPCAGGIPEGHPPLNAFLGLPIYSGEEIIGVAAIANRAGGYDETLITRLQPFLTTCANLMSAYNSRHTAEESQAQIRLLLDSASEGIFGMDQECCAVFANPAACRMVGYSQKELLGRQMHELIHHSYADGREYPITACQMRTTMTEGKARHVTDEVLWRKDGSCFPVEYTSTPIIKEGEVVGAVVIFTDISERQKFDRLKKEFVSTVSHELRTPLTVIQGVLRLLLGNVAGDDQQQVSELLNIANTNADRLLLLINDILDMEKLEAGNIQFEFSDVEVMPLLEDAIRNNSNYADQFHTRFVITQRCEDAVIHADRHRMMQVLTNLMSNAAKFSPPDQPVELAVSQYNNTVRISITDHGPGVPEDFKSKIFDKFSQADSSDTRRISGTGLGLSISRAIINKLGGRIDFTSQPGKGATFYVELKQHRHQATG